MLGERFVKLRALCGFGVWPCHFGGAGLRVELSAAGQAGFGRLSDLIPLSMPAIPNSPGHPYLLLHRDFGNSDDDKETTFPANGG